MKSKKKPKRKVAKRKRKLYTSIAPMSMSLTKVTRRPARRGEIQAIGDMIQFEPDSEE